ncbi:ferredoxin [Denitrovibrio acetiphilus DSM 12809]|uniref:Ferredoxin n=1 Tax=Denitrovibrio acetiphilus (strain DSM 12809 / NBRC 114555 / N2460) TaxID=522772 RepID=D4H6E2_DENA2|nr:2Fe-2S iron-sulfur cluster binding domain-containing protein [Denitrovibrio acetiphilus]ADD69616.1 ferredoxin [Denitrovibrio acetiphilus DSM 12809]
MFGSKKFTVTVTGSSHVLEAKSGTNLYHLLREHDLIDKKLCDGNGQCGKCKVKIKGVSVNKPTKKERLVLAEASLDAGMRLACQYGVKSNITVDTQEAVKFENVNPGIVSLKIKNSNGVVEENEFKSFLTTDMFIKQAERDDKKQTDSKEPEIIEDFSDEVIVDDFVYDERPIEEIAGHSRDTIEIKKFEENEQEEDTSFSNDGLLFIQQPDGVRYYHYSAGIGNVVDDGHIKTSERLENILEDQLISDFIHNNVKVLDIERVIVILDKPYFEGEEMFGLVKYKSMKLGDFLVEVLQPRENHRDLVRFMRFVNQTPGKKLLIPLDNLEKAHFMDDGNLHDMSAGFIDCDSLFGMSEFYGKNPIVSMSKDLLETKLKDDFHLPDSISFTVFFRTASLLMKNGLADRRLNLYDRADVMDDLPLDLTVKLGIKDDVKRFNLYRKQGVDLYIDQNALDSLHRLRIFIYSVITYTEKRFGHIDDVVFYTLTNSDTLADDLISLSAIPKKYEKKVKTFYGDPTMYAVQFFQEKNIEIYFNKRFGEQNFINLDEDELFIETQRNSQF